MYYIKSNDTNKECIAVTLDGLILLTDVLDKSGYGELLSELFDRYGIRDIKDLALEQYVPFAESLRKMATGEFDA
jgi:hypothetical protein